MGFFLLGKRRDDSGLQLLGDTLFATRQDALDALASIDVPSELDSEVYAVDLDMATPVVVVQQRQTASTPEPTAEEAALTTETLDEEPADLHNALKGAAATLEDEGIVAPDSIGPVDDETPADLPAEDAAWPWDSAEGAPPEDAGGDQGEADLDDAIAQSGPPAEYVPDPLEEPAVAVGDMVPTHEVEDVDSSQPVIMGAYRDGETPAPPEDAPHITDELPAEPAFDGPSRAIENEGARNDLETVLADLEIAEPAVEPAPEPEETLPPESESVPDTEEPVQEVAPEPAPESADLLAEAGLDAPVQSEAGFEAGGSDLGELTCDDCVYMNTCPKKGESDPSSCGSFQWKSS